MKLDCGTDSRLLILYSVKAPHGSWLCGDYADRSGNLWKRVYAASDGRIKTTAAHHSYVRGPLTWNDDDSDKLRSHSTSS